MEKHCRKNLITEVLVFIVKIYQVIISPVFGHNCRFYPSCSDYLIEALRHTGIRRGLFLFAKRIIRCHPFNPGGYDPIPGRNSQ